MKKTLGLIFASVIICAHGAYAAEFPYSVDTVMTYTGTPPADGKYLRGSFQFAATAYGVNPKSLNLYADLSTGPGTPVLQTISCGVGEFAAGWTNAYPGVSCNWPDVITLSPGNTLYASVSTAFAPLVASDIASVFPVVTETIQPYPGKPPATCAPPVQKPDKPGVKNSVTANVFQLPGAIKPDGEVNLHKICVTGTPHGQAVVGLRLWGSISARKAGKDVFVGRYMCVVNNAPDTTAAGQSVGCTPSGNNNTPTKMYAPVGSKLRVAITVTFGQPRSVGNPAKPVANYGPAVPSGK